MSRPRYNWSCPKCFAAAGSLCRSLTTNRVTDTHQARLGWVGIFSEPVDEWDELTPDTTGETP